MLPNQAIFTGDNLPMLRGMDSECVDLIYLDPPFNSNANYAAPKGSKSAGAEFKDTWTLEDIDVSEASSVAKKNPVLYSLIVAIGRVNGISHTSYLLFMAPRLVELHRILKDTGSMYLHCDSIMSHSLKLMLDAIFGKQNFRNEIAWCYTGPSNSKRWFPRKHDTILFYAKSSGSIFNADNVRIPYDESTMKRRIYSEGQSGIISPSAETAGARGSEAATAIFGQGKIPEDWWHEKNWGTGGQMARSERTGYPTQKPLKLLQRIIAASSNEGDTVLDPFCGSGTTCVAAEKMNRRYISMDISSKAVELAKTRIEGEKNCPVTESRG